VLALAGKIKRGGKNFWKIKSREKPALGSAGKLVTGKKRSPLPEVRLDKPTGRKKDTVWCRVFLPGLKFLLVVEAAERDLY